MDNLEDRRHKDRRKAHRRVIEKSAEDERRKKAERRKAKGTSGRERRKAGLFEEDPA